jgi:hypothetical protein
MLVRFETVELLLELPKVYWTVISEYFWRITLMLNDCVVKLLQAEVAPVEVVLVVYASDVWEA